MGIRNNYKDCMYKSVTSYKYCIDNNIPYKAMTSLARYYYKKDKISLEEAISKSIDRRIDILNKCRIKEIINIIKENITFKKNDIKKMCKQLNVSSKNVSYIKKRGYNECAAIIIIYYLWDKRNAKNEKIITTKGFDNVMKNYEKYKNNGIAINTRIAVILFCVGIMSANDIFNLLNDGFILKKAKKIIRTYNLNYQVLEDINSELNIGVFDIIQSLLPYERKQIYKYINI